MEYRVFFRIAEGKRLRGAIVNTTSKQKAKILIENKYNLKIETVITKNMYDKIVTADEYTYRCMSKLYKEIADRF